MLDDGTMKDDVKVPEGEVGEKIEKLYRDEKDLSELTPLLVIMKILKTADVIVLTSMGEEVAIEAKEAPRS